MPCYRPLVAYQCANGAVVFHEMKRHEVQKQLLLPCGQCIGCRLERSRQWAARCVHHSQLFKHNSFLTLTYSDENLETPSLQHRDWQLFMKRLRKTIPSPTSNCPEGAGRREAPGAGISYYMAGEYGSLTRRPHFHACLFNYHFTDKKYYRTTNSKSKLYTSNLLTQLWQKGFASIGQVNYQSASYIARYIISKQTGHDAWKYYQHVDEETGEITDLTPEYNRMSLRPAIGKDWLKKYASDIYPEGTLQVGNEKTKSTKYYDRQFKKEEPDAYEEMKMRREMQAREYLHDNTPERLKVKETVKLAQVNQLLRIL